MISLFSQLFFVSSRAQRLECWVTTQRTPGKETISLHPRMQNKLGFEILMKVAQLKRQPTFWRFYAF